CSDRIVSIHLTKATHRLRTRCYRLCAPCWGCGQSRDPSPAKDCNRSTLRRPRPRRSPAPRFRPPGSTGGRPAPTAGGRRCSAAVGSGGSSTTPRAGHSPGRSRHSPSLWRDLPVLRPFALAATGILALAGCSGSDAATAGFPAWHNSSVNAVSRMAAAGGVVTTTSMKPDGTLETVAVNLDDGKKLWAHPATMAGRLPGMGVSAPAIVETAGGQAVVAALDPAKKGRWKATLVVRDARTGEQKWTRPVHSTVGLQRCGPYRCMSEHTALSSARVVVLDPATGKQLWKLPGIAEVEWSDAEQVVMLRLATDPTLESYDLKTGKL